VRIVLMTLWTECVDVPVDPVAAQSHARTVHHDSLNAAVARTGR
jgi:hypothetical protein